MQPLERRKVDALILMGGGVKGLAHAGAIRELERFFEFSEYVGTSAGAIGASLLAANYTASELEIDLGGLDFRQFLDGGLVSGPWRLISQGGLHSGEPIQSWLEQKLFDRIRQTPVRFDHLSRGLTVYAASRGMPNDLVEFGTDSTPGSAVAYGVRCSMSIPLFFVPERIEGQRVYDGGMLANFPVEQFVSKFPEKTFIALYLGRRGPTRRVSMLRELFAILTSRGEIAATERYHERTVFIETEPIGTVDFSLSELEKKYLICAGRAAALTYLLGQQLGSAYEHKDALEGAASLRAQVRAGRRKAVLSRTVVFLVVFVGMLALLGLYGAGHSQIHAPTTVSIDDLGLTVTSDSMSSESEAGDAVSDAGVFDGLPDGTTVKHDSSSAIHIHKSALDHGPQSIVPKIE